MRDSASGEMVRTIVVIKGEWTLILPHREIKYGPGVVLRTGDDSFEFLPGLRPCQALCWPARPDLGERWPSRLVATAKEDRLSVPPTGVASRAANKEKAPTARPGLSWIACHGS